MGVDPPGGGGISSGGGGGGVRRTLGGLFHGFFQKKVEETNIF